MLLAGIHLCWAVLCSLWNICEQCCKPGSDVLMCSSYERYLSLWVAVLIEIRRYGWYVAPAEEMQYGTLESGVENQEIVMGGNHDENDGGNKLAWGNIVQCKDYVKNCNFDGVDVRVCCASVYMKNVGFDDMG